MNTTAPKAETHSQRVIRLQGEYKYRYERYRGDPGLWPLLQKLLLMDPKADNSLASEELDALDKKLEPIRAISRRFQKKAYGAA